MQALCLVRIFKKPNLVEISFTKVSECKKMGLGQNSHLKINNFLDTMQQFLSWPEESRPIYWAMHIWVYLMHISAYIHTYIFIAYKCIYKYNKFIIYSA